MKALMLNCTLKPSPAESNTEQLARVVMDALAEHDVETELVRVVDHLARALAANPIPAPESSRTAGNQGVLGEFLLHRRSNSPSTPF